MRKLMFAMTAAALASAVPASAQQMTNPVIPSLGCTQPYIVQEGDNLWTLAQLRLQNPELWRWLVQQNPILQESGRFVTRDGKEIVLIRPGEALYCLEEAGINLGTTNSPRVDSAVPAAEKSFAEKLMDFLSDWWWLALLLIGGALLLWFLRELGKDPIRSGAPQVTGGVSNQTVRDQFERRGSTRGFTLLPGSIVRGRGYGRMMVSYYGGAERPRTLSGEPIYRATARYHDDGREEDVYMLQGCGNDVTSGGAAYRLLSNFRFVEGEAIAEPSTEPVMEAVTVPPAAPAEPQADFEGELARGTIQVSVQGPRSEGDKASLRVSGASLDGLSIQLSDRSLTVRWVPDETE